MKYTLYKLLQANKIVVPLIQRDFAQGRESATELRKSFLNKIKEVLESESGGLNLDFVYGYTEKERDVFVPLDGQQRLTTLWLIHWYAAYNENIIKKDTTGIEEKETLKKFTYQTRLSAKRFCHFLIESRIKGLFKSETLSKKIIDAPKFMSSWINDPTIVSMLNMINSIHETFADVENVWDKLVDEDRITFDYIDIKSEEFKLTDELYIKMNSRGKPLTSFESFKALFSDLLSSKQNEFHDDFLVYNDANVKYQEYFAFKIDCEWMDLFWDYRLKHDIQTDTGILNFVYFIAEVLFYRKHKEDEDFIREFKSLKEVFSTRENILFLFNSLDFLAKQEDVEQFFKDLLSKNYKIDKVTIFENRTVDLLRRCLSDNYFEVKHKILSYSVLKYCISTKSNVPDESMKYFIRVIRNLLNGVRQINAIRRIEYTSNLRVSRMRDYSRFIDGFIIAINENQELPIFSVLAHLEYKGFTKGLIRAEQDKAKLFLDRPEMINDVWHLEDHIEIQGNISCFNIDSEDIREKINAFNEIWNKNIDSSLIIRAFLTVGDYSICSHYGTALGNINYFGSSSNWNRILTAGNKEDRNKIRDLLDQFLNVYCESDGNDVEVKLENIIDNYTSDTKNWMYYFITYGQMTTATYDLFHLYSWKDNNGFDINKLGSAGRNPLLAYHLNPYTITVYSLLKDTSNLELYWGRYSTETSYISVKGKVHIHSKSWGWRIYEFGNILPHKIIEKYNIKVDDNYYALPISEDEDRVEIAVDFIKELVAKI